MRRIFTLLLVTLGAQLSLGTSAFAAAADQVRSVNITFFDCAANKEAPSDVRVSLFTKSGLLSSFTFPEATPAKVRHITIRVVPGQYGLSVANSDCADDLLLSVLPGVDRDVVALAGSKSVLISNYGRISGALPNKGWQVAIVFKNRRGTGRCLSIDGFFQVPALVDGNAYYANYLPSGAATLRLYNQGLYRWIEFDLGDITPDTPTIVRNVTSEDVETALLKLGGI